MVSSACDAYAVQCAAPRNGWCDLDSTGSVGRRSVRSQSQSPILPHWGTTCCVSISSSSSLTTYTTLSTGTSPLMLVNVGRRDTIALAHLLPRLVCQAASKQKKKYKEIFTRKPRKTPSSAVSTY